MNKSIYYIAVSTVNGEVAYGIKEQIIDYILLQHKNINDFIFYIEGKQL